MATKQMHIEGMSSVRCQKTITEALARAGAYNIHADWRQGRATFDVVGASAEQLEEAVDEAGYRQFVYSAAYEGNIAARNALAGEGRTFDFHSLPRVIFTSPTFAAAGLTDEEAESAVLAIQFGLTTDDIASSWAPYLTFAEAFKLAAQIFKREVSKLSCCAA